MPQIDDTYTEFSSSIMESDIDDTSAIFDYHGGTPGVPNARTLHGGTPGTTQQITIHGGLA